MARLGIRRDPTYSSRPRLPRDGHAPFHFTAVTVRRSTASATSVQNNVGFTEKNIRTDLDAMQEIV